MRFPVMKFETEAGVDYRIGTTFSRTTRAGSELIGYISADSIADARRKLKAYLANGLRGSLYTKKKGY